MGLHVWLRSVVEKGECAGVIWEDKELGQFRIPWHNQKSKFWNKADSQIFMEYAKYRDMYRPDDKPDFPKWKQNLKSAINKNQDIKRLKELDRRGGSKPYRVYKFVSAKNCQKLCKPLSAEPHFNDPSTSILEQLQSTHIPSQVNHKICDVIENQVSGNIPKFDGLFNSEIGGRQNAFDFEMFQEELQIGQTRPASYVSINSNEIGSINNIICKQDQNSQIQTIPDINITLNQEGPLNCVSESVFAEGSGTKMFQTIPEMNVPFNHAHLQGPLNGTNEGASAVDSGSMMFQTIPPEINEPVNQAHLNGANEGASAEPNGILMQIHVLYGTPHYVANKILIKSPQKSCRIFYGSANIKIIREEIQEPRDCLQVELSKVTEGKVMDKEREALQELLNNFEIGIIISYKDGDIYADRRCRPRVFVSNGVDSSSPLTRSSGNRQTNHKIFDYENFRNLMEDNKLNKQNPLPRDHVCLTIGREIIPNDDSPTRKVPLYILIRHIDAAKERFEVLGTAGAISPNPMYSDPNSFDNLLESFGIIKEILDLK